MTLHDVVDEMGIKLDGLRTIADWMESAENRADHGIPDGVGMIVGHGVLLSTTIAELERLLTVIMLQSRQPEEVQPLPDGPPTLTVV